MASGRGLAFVSSSDDDDDFVTSQRSELTFGRIAVKGHAGTLLFLGHAVETQLEDDNDICIRFAYFCMHVVRHGK